MKEDFLHHIWQFKKFDIQNLTTVKGEPIEIINSGQYLQQSGPDFFNAQLRIGSQTWAGNVEIHIKSSDWYLHSHERDAAYDNVILHVVWEHDTEVIRQDTTEIPVLELKNYVEAQVLNNYNALSSAKTWIYCEKELETLNSFVLENWKERLFFERLERKALPIVQLAAATNGDWEAVLFCFLAKNFGLNINGDTFYAMAKSLPFSVVRKESFEVENLEALLMGSTGLLDDKCEDFYPKDLITRYNYIVTKHRLELVHINKPEFFRHRPDNFPTIRLSQLAQLYHVHQNLFSKIITLNTVEDIYKIFSITVSSYWQTHYTFDKESSKKRKALTKSFIDLLIINTVIPFRFAYAKSRGEETSEELLQLLQQLPPEKNSIIEKFKHYKIPVTSAYDTQALLQLKNEYCNNKRCMQCSIGLELLKK
ncbi:DUF2851 family protein [Flavobacterium arcticum]|uniref:DUF2851 family protein n=1 Tax=Flavobacterium arcticum TaxID=1784713 RepID=A0A345H8D9_9FLAO|nr:DUF2851 family protein [Flavobacterium arcticum]AXG72849.1 DUF2851 family protein [Flavobacterium arcticum]KAF2510486.1 DUF2851 family protein [Flavobacterium arcticum]